MRIVFMGTPQFGADILNKLVASRHEVVGVFCQPDRKGNRNKLIECETAKHAACCEGIPVFKCERVSRDGLDTLKELAPDVIVTAAYGQMLSDAVLSVARFGVLNVHGSLLPRYRGASPVQSAIIDGARLNGVTIMKTVKKMDAGDVLRHVFVEITPDMTASDTFKVFADKGGDALLEVLDEIENGRSVAIPQNRIKFNPENKTFVKPSYCKKLTKDDEKINWNESAVKVHRRIMGLSENPCAYTMLNGQVFKIYRSRVSEIKTLAEAGEVIRADKTGITVACRRGAVDILEGCLQGGKKMGYRDFVNGKKIKVGDILGEI